MIIVYILYAHLYCFVVYLVLLFNFVGILFGRCTVLKVFGERNSILYRTNNFKRRDEQFNPIYIGTNGALGMESQQL
jgi:hypothetical protein